MSVLFAIFCIFAALTCGIAIGYYMGNKDGYELGKWVGRGDGIRDMREKYQAKIDELNAEIEELRDDVKAKAE